MRRGPTKALCFNRRAFRLGTDQRIITGAVHFAECVAAGDLRHGFLIIHRHAGEGFAHILTAQKRVGIAIGALRVDVNQAHLHGGQRVFQRLTGFGIAIIAEPFIFRTPVNIFFRMPNIGATTAKAEGLAAHAFNRNIARENQQIGPTNGIAVFLFDRPQQAPRLVEIAIIRPAIERRKTLRARATAAAPVAGAICAGRVPGHADKERAIMTVIGRPPFLAVGHQRRQILLKRGIIDFFEFFTIIEIIAHRIRFFILLAQYAQIELVRPPVLVRGSCLLIACQRTMHDRAF